MALSSHHFVTSNKTALVNVTNDVHIIKSIANFQFSSTLINHQHDMLVHPIFLKTLSDLVSRTLLAAPPAALHYPPSFNTRNAFPVCTRWEPSHSPLTGHQVYTANYYWTHSRHLSLIAQCLPLTHTRSPSTPLQYWPLLMSLSLTSHCKPPLRVLPTLLTQPLHPTVFCS